MRAEARKLLREWLGEVLGGRAGLYDRSEVPPPQGAPELAGASPEVIFANQNAPRPPLPYFTLLLTAIRKVGHDETAELATDDPEGFRRVSRGQRQFTASLQAFGPGALELLEAVQDALELEREQERLAERGIVVYETAGIADVTVFLESGAEERGALDLMCRAAVALVEDVGVIETVSGEGEFGDRPHRRPFAGPPERLEGETP